MEPADGYNPMRWNCDLKGCFQEKGKPKIERFHECFPGKVNFSDIDGITELGGSLLVLEWKAPGDKLLKSQRLIWEALTRQCGNHGRRENLAVIVWGDTETTEPEKYATIYRGVYRERGPVNFDGLCDVFEKWSHLVDTRPTIRDEKSRQEEIADGL